MPEDLLTKNLKRATAPGTYNFCWGRIIARIVGREDGRRNDNHHSAQEASASRQAKTTHCSKVSLPTETNPVLVLDGGSLCVASRHYTTLHILIRIFPSSPPSSLISHHLKCDHIPHIHHAFQSTSSWHAGCQTRISLVTTISHGQGLRAKSKQILRSQEAAHHRHPDHKSQLVQACQLAQCHSDRRHTSLWSNSGLVGTSVLEDGCFRRGLLLHEWPGNHSW